MLVAVHGRARNERSQGFIREFFPKLVNLCDSTVISEELGSILGMELTGRSTMVPTDQLVDSSPDIFLSLGGDGTILEATRLVGRSQVPILGINTGRMGYLASVGHAQAEKAVQRLISGDYHIEERRLLEVTSSTDLFGEQNFALNEFAIHKSDSASMITVHVEVNGVFLNSYWADGLIIATPTGSTGYSLSCGGPIVSPNTHNIVLTPISPHNLTVRPLIINDGSKLKLRTDTNEDHFRVSADSRSCIVEPDTQLEIGLADFTIKFIHFGDHDHFSTLRTKLMWGHDSRN